MSLFQKTAFMEVLHNLLMTRRERHERKKKGERMGGWVGEYLNLWQHLKLKNFTAIRHLSGSQGQLMLHFNLFHKPKHWFIISCFCVQHFQGWSWILTSLWREKLHSFTLLLLVLVKYISYNLIFQTALIFNRAYLGNMSRNFKIVSVSVKNSNGQLCFSLSGYYKQYKYQHILHCAVKIVYEKHVHSTHEYTATANTHTFFLSYLRCKHFSMSKKLIYLQP